MSLTDAPDKSMELRDLGYACVNQTLDRTTGHTLRLDNLTDAYVAEVIAKNFASLQAILEWNIDRDIRFFRISSSFIPFASHPTFQLPWRDHFADQLGKIRQMVIDHDLRLSMHPGQYTVLNSNKEEVADRAIDEINYHGKLLDELCPTGGDIVLHVGGAYGDKPASLDRFARRFERVSESARRQLIVENDDTVYTVDEVLELCERLDRPLVFDIFHHQCNHRRQHWRDGLGECLEAVMATWQARPPKCHISTGREGARISHADYVSDDDFQTFLKIMSQVDGAAPFDLMVEAKAKEKAVLALRNPS